MLISEWRSDVCSSVLGMSHSRLVDGLASSLWDRSDFFISTAIGTRLFADRLADAHREHEAVVSALARRDGPTASTLMAAHCMAFGNRIGESMHLTTRSEEHTSELQSLMRISYAVFCLKKKKQKKKQSK